ncbi:regulatory protein suaprga1 [Mycena sanguinolenta]|nr:regulatory protein suaprga1 [Mycena sanguinolenta]
MSSLRAVRQLTRTSTRLRLSSQPALRAVLSSARPAVTRSFTASARSFKPASATTIQLAEKLRDEISYEDQAVKDTKEEVPEFLANFVEAGTWEIKDTPGNDEVFLTRKFGDESIRVMFSIADLQGLEDEDEGTDNEDNEPPPTELRVSLSISKSTHDGAINADLYCANDSFQVASWGFFTSARIGQDLSIESDFARRTIYTGPLFETLDTELQGHFEEFLRERGIDQNLAAFIPEYAQWKEQQEYVQWLKNVESFVAA